jgi:hypothetical protein
MNKGRENSLTHQQARYYVHLGQDQLIPAEQGTLDTHLANCTDCRRYAGEVAGLQSRLAETMRLRWQKQIPSPVINGQAQTRLRRKIRQHQVWRLTHSVATAAATLLLVAALAWLAWRTRPGPDTPVAGVTLTAPASPQLPVPAGGDGATLPGLVIFGNQAKLLGYSLPATSFAPGDTVNLSLYGQTQSANFAFFAHLFEADNTVVAQSDVPGSAAACSLVSRHSAGLVVTCLSLALPSTLPAGSYQLRVGVYDQANGQRLTTPDGQESFLLTPLQVGLLPPKTPPSLPTPAPAATPYPIPASCPVTLPNGNTPPGESPSPTYHGNGQLWTALWPDGLVLIPPLMVQPDGSLSMKWGWWRGTNGRLTIEGHRLDTSAPPLGAVIPDGYGDTGFQPGGLIFPTEGCWEVTGQVGNSTLTFVVYVTKVDRLE